MYERHHARRTHLDHAMARRLPLHGPAQHAGPQVENPLVGPQLAVADVKRFVVDKEADDLAIGDIDDRLTGFRVAVGRLGVWQWDLFVDGVEVRTGERMRLSLVEVRAPADVSVR